MLKLIRTLPGCLEKYRDDGSAIAAVEFTLIFPILFTMIIGVWGVGNGILVDQKAIAASQIISDLICRNESVTQEQIDDAIKAGELAISPFDTAPYIVDIVSVQFDEDGDPVELWRETTKGATPDDTLAARTKGLGGEGEGAVAVRVTYRYVPLLGASTWGTFNLGEIAFGRGRKSAIVTKI
jgi:Flp pilus assembly protein TadG